MARPTKLTDRIDWQTKSAAGIVGDFTSERAMCNFIEDNIDLFTIDIVGQKMLEYKREYSFGERVIFGRTRPTRVDFYIQTADHKILVEVKNNYSTHSARSLIGQILSYGAKGDYDKLVVVVPGVNDVLLETIQKYELPIQVVLLTKQIIGKWDIQWAALQA